MLKKYWSILLFFLSLQQWLFPQWNGILFNPSLDVTAGDGRIISSILFVGGLLLWYIPERNSK